MTDLQGHRRRSATSSVDSPITIGVLGPVTVHRAGSEIEVGARLRHLLAALVVADGRVVSIDRLAEVVWDGEPPEAAERTLRTYVTRLRRALDADTEVLRHREPGYLLDQASVEVDAHTFDAETDLANQQLRAGDGRSALATLDGALARWRGDAYAGLGDHEWFRPEVVRLEGRQLEAKMLRTEALLACGDNDRAVAEAEALVATEPLSEPPRMLLMRALYASGRQADAMRVLPEFRALLVDEVGLDPSDAMRELESRVARGERGLGSAVRLRGYEVHERIGEGAFAVVHRAVQPGVDRDVAVKIVRGELADRPEFIRRFEHEAHLAARLEHPHIVPLYDFWRDPGAAYLVMRLLRGGSVADALRRSGPFSRERTLQVVGEMAGALEVAHRAQVVHRDIKPANVLLDDDGHAYLADFGIATAISAIDGIEIESPAYAAPEQLRHERVGPSADVLSLGITVFEMLTGRLPFADSRDRAELIRHQLESPVPPVSATRTDLPAGVDEVLARATAKAAADRHPSTAQFVAELTAALAPAGDAATVPRWSIRTAEAVNPYVGLHAFDEADADRFHGREALVAALADRVAASRLVTVVGPSGTGKSSIVRAGLLPALRKGATPGSDEWFVTTMFPGPDPFGALEDALLRVAVRPPTSLREHLAEPGGLHRAVRRVLPAEKAQLLVVIDQFEELFTHTDELDARRFLDELAAALGHPESPLRIVATLRADHFDRPLSHRAIAPLVSEGLVPIVPMSAEEIERAIVAPARSVGVDVEPALVAELVAAVTDRPAALPMLQFCLSEGFDRRVSDVMLLSAYRDGGGLAGALSARADRVVFSDGSHGDEQAARRLFGRLVTLGDGTDDARRRARRSELGDDETTSWMIDALARARLLSYGTDPATREPTVEIAHEALLREWPRLRHWIDDDRTDLSVLRQVTTAAAGWEASGRDVGELARGGRLDTAIELRDRRPELLSSIELEWIDASDALRSAEEAAQQAAVERDRRHRRRLRRSLVVTAALAIVAVLAAAVSLIARDRAARAEAAALGRALVRDADANLETDPELAQLLAIESAAQFRRAGQDVPAVVAGTLREGASASRIRGRVPGGLFAAVDADGRTMATRHDDGGIALWDVRTLELIDTTGSPPVGNVRTVWFDHDGHVRVVASRGSGSVDDPELVEVFDWSVAGREWHSVLPEPIPFDGSVDADPVSGRVAIASDGVRVVEPDGTVVDVAVDVAADAELRTTAVALSGERVAYAAQGATTSIRVVTIGADDDLVIDPAPLTPLSMAFNASGQLLAIADATVVAMVDLATGEPIWQSQDLPRAARVVWLSGDDRLAVFGEAGIFVLDAATGDVLDHVPGENPDVVAPVPGSDLAFSADGSSRQTVLVDLGVPIDDPNAFQSPRDALQLAVDDTGQRLLVRDEQDITVLDADSGEAIWSTEGLEKGRINDVRDENYFTFAVWNRPVDRIAAPDPDGRSHLYDADGTPVWTAPDGWDIRGVSDDGSQVVIWRAEVGARLVDVTTGHSVAFTQAPVVNIAQFSPNGRYVSLSSGAGPRLEIASTTDGVVVATVEASDEMSRSMWHDYSPDGPLLAVGDLNGQVVIYDLDALIDGSDQEAAVVGRFDAQDSMIAPVLFSPDGTMLATVGRGTEPARIWTIDGDLVAEFGMSDARTGFAFHPTEPWVYVGEGTRITRHTLDLDELIESATAGLTRTLTDEECQRYLERSCPDADRPELAAIEDPDARN